MKLFVRKTKNDASLYIVKSYRLNGKSTSRIMKTCGRLSELKEQYDDPIAYFKQVAIEMTNEEKLHKHDDVKNIRINGMLNKGEEKLLNGGVLFLRKIYRDLKLDKICKKISKEHEFQYDLDKILEDLIFTRIICPGSKLSGYEDAKGFIESPNYELHDIYRALSVLNEYFDYIQAEVYKNSNKIIKRNKTVLYFDCTNFYFEIEQADEFRKYGFSKEHRPNPIVQMGLFMDGSGFPLAFDLHPGNTNEQITLRPLESKVLKDFNLSKIIVCTDAGLASYSNREFNNVQDRAFIVTQSIKKLPAHLKSWALENNNFKKLDEETGFSFTELVDKYQVIYKSRYMKEDITVDTPLGRVNVNREWRLIVTYSKKYAIYQKSLRENQIKRAKAIINNPSGFNKVSAQDCKRFISNLSFTNEGEIATKKKLIFNEEVVKEEEKYDGFYAVTTNLTGDAKEIVRINHNRWKIEECIRIMKTDMSARPIYCSLKEHIKGHFLTCFLDLLIAKIIDAKVKQTHTMSELLETIRAHKYTSLGNGYVASFKRTDLTDELDELFFIESQYQYYSPIEMRELINQSKA